MSDTLIILSLILIILLIDLGIKIYFIYNWRMALDRLAAIVVDRWLSGQGHDQPLY